MFNPKEYRQGMYAHRETMDDALNYAYSIATASDNSAAVVTAVHVVLNTMIDLCTAPPAEPMTHDQYLQAARTMVFQGGSFAASIGDAYIHADGLNRPRLVTAFNDLFTRFAKETA